MIKKISLLLMLLIVGNNALAMNVKEYEESERCKRRGELACGFTLTGVCLGTALFLIFYTGGTSGDCDVTNSTGRANGTNCSNTALWNDTNRSTVTPPPARQTRQRRLR